jgi:uncharacterized protein YfdQ (DUF2303 family)
MSDFKDAHEAGKALAHAESIKPFIDADGKQRLILPDGLKIQTLAEPLKPVRKKGMTVFANVESFVAYVKRHETDFGTMLYASKSGLSIEAVFNDNEPGHNGEAGHGDFKGALRLTHTNDWNAWMLLDKRQKSQVELADFLEDQLHTIAIPDSGVLMAAIKTLQVQKSVTYKSAVNLDNGSVQFTYDDVVAGNTRRGEVEVPSRLVLGLEPFEGSARYEVKARLRYKLTDAGLAFTLTLDRPDRVRDSAFADVLKTIEGTGHTPLMVP